MGSALVSPPFVALLSWRGATRVFTVYQVIVLSVSVDEADEDHLVLVVDNRDDSVVIAIDIEADQAIPQQIGRWQAGRSRVRSSACRLRPLSSIRGGTALRLGTALRTRAGWAGSGVAWSVNDILTHIPNNLFCSRYGKS